MSVSSSKAPKAQKPAKAAALAPDDEHATVPVRVSPTVHKFVISRANWGESIDRTLRRLLKIPDGVKAVPGGGR